MTLEELEKASIEIEAMTFYRLTPVRKQILFNHYKHMPIDEFIEIIYKCFKKTDYNPTLEDIIMMLHSKQE